jgi:hypothetical protein
MNAHDEDRIKKLLQQALPRVDTDTDADTESDRDLWPALLRRLPEQSAGQSLSLPWFDWALLAGLAGFAVLYPVTIPVFLYYL